MKARGQAGENRATLRAGFVANGDDVGKHGAGFDNIRNRLRLMAGNIQAEFVHRFNGQWIEFARFETGAARFKLSAANLIQKCLRHLAAGAVVDANKQDFPFHNAD